MFQELFLQFLFSLEDVDAKNTVAAGHLYCERKGCCGCPMPVVYSLLLWVRLRTGLTSMGSTTYNLLVVGSRVAQIDVDIPFVARAMVALLEQLSLFRTQQLRTSWIDSISIRSSI